MSLLSLAWFVNGINKDALTFHDTIPHLGGDTCFETNKRRSTNDLDAGNKL